MELIKLFRLRNLRLKRFQKKHAQKKLLWNLEGYIDNMESDDLMFMRYGLAKPTWEVMNRK